MISQVRLGLLPVRRCDPRRQGVLLVAESGIHSGEDVTRLQRTGASAFLVGESLMREADIGLALERLRRTT